MTLGPVASTPVAPSSTGTLDLGGFAHHYQAWLPATPRTAPLVALHGFGVTGWRTYRYLAPFTLAAGIPLYAPDLLGFGRSERPDDGHSLARYADLTHAFTERLGLGTPVLMGHSLGGKIASATVTYRPDAWRGLLLVNPGGFSRYAALSAWMMQQPWANWVLGHPWFGRHIVPRTPLQGFLEGPEAIQQLLRFQDAHRALDLDATGLRTRLRSLDLPVRVLWGDADAILPPSTPARILRDLPHAEVIPLPGAGHGPMKDQPQAFGQATVDFMRTVAALPPPTPHTPAQTGSGG